MKKNEAGISRGFWICYCYLEFINQKDLRILTFSVYIYYSILYKKGWIMYITTH